MATILFATADIDASVAGYFQDLGHTVVVEADSSRAFSLLASMPVDVLVTSVLVRGGDGFSVRDFARSKHPGVAALLLTGLGSDGRPMKAWNGEFESYCFSREYWQIVLCIEQLLTFNLTRK